MARIRSLKPGFFSNEELCELSPWHRLCFAGLWTVADREGRLEDRPRRLKAAIFPYDDLDMNALLEGLEGKGFVIRYVADGVPYIAIPTFSEHQRPKHDEAVSAIPAPLLANPRGKVLAPRPYKGQGTEDRGQRTEGIRADVALASAAGADASSEAADGADGQLRADDFAELWNTVTHPPIPRCRDLTAKRRRQIKARITERPFESWREVFLKIQASSFCRGQSGGDRHWVATFDWAIGSPDVAVKVLEGKYDDRGSETRQTPERREYEIWREKGCPHTPRCPHFAACQIVSARTNAS